MSKQFKFVGGTSRTKNDWPVDVLAFCIRRSYDGVGAKEVFVEALALMNEARSQQGLAPLASLPNSYTKHAASLIWGIKTRFAKALGKGSQAHRDAAAKYNLPEVVEVEQAQ